MSTTISTLALLAGPALTLPSLLPGDEFWGLRSEDGEAELQVEGLFQTVFGLYDSDRDPSSDAELKRMRPEFVGRFRGLRFKLEPKFQEHSVELEEAWIGTDLYDGNAVLMLGRMKVPFNLEEVRSRRHIDFPAFSVVNQLAPAEDHGVFMNGRSDSGFWEYGLSLTNGTGASDTNSSKDFAARVMVHPWVDEEDSGKPHLELGLAATIGTQEAGVGGDALHNESGGDVVRFADSAALDGERRRLGLEAAWYDGPWFAQAEWVDVTQEMTGDGGDQDVSLRGGYLTLAHVLTGEEKTFGGVNPDQPFDFSSGTGRGAWVVALRLSQLEIDDDLVSSGLAQAGEATDRISTVALGLNWIPNGNMIVRHSLIWSGYGDKVRLDDGRDDEEVALLVEFQLHF